MRTPRSLRPVRPSSASAGRLGIAGLAVVLALVTGCSSSSDGSKGDKKSTSTTKAGEDPTATIAPDSTTSTTKAEPIDPESPPTAEDYTAGIISLITGNTPLGADDQASVEDCLAPAWVEIIGVDTFVDKGLAPEDLTSMGGGLETLGLDQGQATAMMDAFDTCEIDVRSAVIAQITANPTLDEAAKACIEAKVTAEAVRQSFIADLIGEELEGGPFSAAQDCVADGAGG